MRLKTICIVSLLNWIALGQDLPYLRRLTINSQTSLDTVTQMFFYSYSLSNDSNNRGNIWVFEIDISLTPNSVSFDTAGLRFAKSFMESGFRRHYPKLASRIVPVGFPVVPRFWDGALSNNLTASFGVDSLLPRPGQSVNGLVIMSHGLPGVRRCVVKPYLDVDSLYPSVDEVNNPDSLVAKIERDREAVKFRGITIVPTAPPANLIPIAFLDTLTSYKHQASALGWIDSVGVVNSLDQKLTIARRLIERGNINAARNILNAFINEVEAQNGHHLTSEAYALLKFNAEYLRDHL